MKKRILILLIIFQMVMLNTYLNSETIEEIYAIVNNELITYSEIMIFRNGMTIELKRRFKGDELAAEIKKMEENLLDMLIGRKVIFSKAKEKNYDLTQYLDLIIKDIMKRNNINSKDELIIALKSQGVSFEEFKNQRLEQLMQEKFIQEELGDRIKIETSELVDYYKKNIKDYTKPLKVTLHCIFLNKDLYFSKEALKDKKDKINSELKLSKDFKKTAENHSDLETSENKYLLGTFSKGEIDSKLEEVALKLKVNEFSDWIETENGLYIIQLAEKIPPVVTEYKNVKKEIEFKLSSGLREIEVEKLVKQLKKDSHIEILKKIKY
ncbi:MAG: peptidylprolyl isomerase [Acidobacteriota bacterium]